MSFSINDFTTQINKQGGIARTNKFRLFITPPTKLSTQYKNSARIQEHLQYAVQSASIPTKTVSTNAVLAPGSEQKYPYAHEMEDLTLTILCTRDFIERKFIDDWMNEVVQPIGGSFTIGYRNEYSAKIQLQVYSEYEETPVDIIDFYSCFPLSSGAVDLSYEEQGEVATFEVVFHIDYWERVTIDDLPDEYTWKTRVPAEKMIDKVEREWQSSPFRQRTEEIISEPVSRFERAKELAISGYNKIKKYTT